MKRCSDSPDVLPDGGTRAVGLIALGVVSMRDTVNGLRGFVSECGTSLSESVVRSESSGSDSTSGAWAWSVAKGLAGGGAGEADEEGSDGRDGGSGEVDAEDKCGSGPEEGTEASGGEDVGSLAFALDCGPLAANSMAPERLTLAWTLHGFKGKGWIGLSSGLSASLSAQHAPHQHV